MYYCFQAGLYWQGLIHDLSKFSIYEFWKNSSEAYKHHIKINPHHYEYWILNNDNFIEMSRKYALELICDYLANQKIKQVYEWWNDNRSILKIHEDTKCYINNVLNGFYRGKSLREAIQFADMLQQW